MKNSIFDYRDYKVYLRDWIAVKPNGGRGQRLKFSSALNCHPSYIAQVLNGNADLSLEQAEQLNPLLLHNEPEGEFFLLLVQYARAGTASLKKRFQTQVQRQVEVHLDLKHRLEFKKILSLEDQATYYSSWAYAAVHVGLAVSALQEPLAMSRCLGLPLARVLEILQFLTQVGLANAVQGRYQIGTSYIHLDNSSPLIRSHHIHWRSQAIQSLERRIQGDLHYSSIVTLARADIQNVRSILVEAIEKVRKTVRNSPEETLFCYNLDLFQVGLEESPRASASAIGPWCSSVEA